MSIGILFIGVLAIIASICIMLYDNLTDGRYHQRPARQQKNKRFSVGIIILGCLLIVFSQCFTIVPTGATGVRTTFGQISPAIASPGFNWKIPFAEKIDLVNNKQQDREATKQNEKIWCESVGKIPLFAEDVIVTYQINPEKSAWIYTNVTDYKNNLISYGLVSSALKSCTVSLSIEEVTNRTRIEGLTAEALQMAVDEKFDAGTIRIIRVVIGNMDFEESYNEAINSKNKAIQIAEEQAIKNKQAVDKAEADATVKLTEAQAEADSLKIKATGEAHAMKTKADAEAYANGVITDSLNSLILANNWIVKWNGAQPYVVGSDGQIIDISALLKQ